MQRVIVNDVVYVPASYADPYKQALRDIRDLCTNEPNAAEAATQAAALADRILGETRADHEWRPTRTIEGTVCGYCKGPKDSPRHYEARS